MIPSLEIYRQFGVGLQVYYIQSVRAEIYDFLMAYKNAGAVELEPWTLLDLGNNNLEDPNQNLEWRNQAGAHTDCFLKYREAADFIIVSDIDDVLVPKLGKTYIDEFNFLNDKYPSAAGFLYNRYNTQLYSANSPMDFSLYHLLRTSRIANEWEDGKSVVKTSEVQTVWLHWPAIVNEGRRMQLISEQLNFMIHMRNWTMLDRPREHKIRRKRTILHDRQMKNFISKEKSQELEMEAKKFILKNAKKEFELLPTNMVYYPLIEDCYNRIFYSKARHPDTCPGPLQCELPIFIPRVKCTVAKRKLVHKSISKHLQIHFSPTEPTFMFLPHGCRMKFSIN
uniref:Glycosyltransferase family 92 protein n=1 Tax=Panagrolaimus sp. JU765 TaxID=591449 RepID=A0AC34PZS2_9BILA